MHLRKLSVYTAFILCLVGAFTLLSDLDFGSSTSYRLTWRGVTSTGNETASRETGTPSDTIRSENYILASSGGQSTPVMNNIHYSSATSSYLHPGYLQIYHDGEPVCWLRGIVTERDTTGLDPFMLSGLV
jgi:hypothetical protein